MLIKESTLRRIIREEAHRALREQVTPAIAPVAGAAAVPPPAPVAGAAPAAAAPAASTTLTVDEAAVAANKAFNGNYKRQLLGLWEQYLKVDPAATSVVTFQFQINTNGTVDPKANVKVTCKPDPTRTVPPNPPTTFSAEFKKLMMTWKFAPASEPFIYEHPSSLKFGS